VRVPPRLVRRIVTIPLAIFAMVWLLAFVPVWLILAAFVSRFVPGKWRVLRLMWFGVVYLALEVLAVTVLFVLWLWAGFGTSIRSAPSMRRHVVFMAWLLRRLMASARFTFKLRFEHDDSGVRADPTRPLLVFARHAGAGDSFLLIDRIVNGDAPRRPLIVLKDLLQLDPAIDVLLNRIGATFVGGRSSQRSDVVDAIAAQAASATASDAVVIFPEGGNFTAGRRTRAIEKLESMGRDDLVERARDLEHVLPPKPLGAMTAIDASPTATIAFIGHAGLEPLSSPAGIWRSIPMGHAVRTRMWSVPAEDIPVGRAERELWLYDHWEVIDTWLSEAAQREASNPSSLA
jgi:1-acyl-sn-glycerol-3-phosphate acyltransferase